MNIVAWLRSATLCLLILQSCTSLRVSSDGGSRRRLQDGGDKANAKKCEYTVRNESLVSIRLRTAQGTETSLIASGASQTFESIARDSMTVLNKSGDAIQTIKNQACESTFVFNGESFDKCTYQICNQAPATFALQTVTTYGNELVQKLGDTAEKGCIDVSIAPSNRIQALLEGSNHDNEKPTVRFSHSTCGTKFDICGEHYVNKDDSPKSVFFDTINGHQFEPIAVEAGESALVVGDCDADLVVADLLCDYTVLNDSSLTIRIQTGQGTETRLIAPTASETFTSFARDIMTILDKGGNAIQTIRNQACESTFVFNGEKFDKCTYQICNMSPSIFALHTVTNYGSDIVDTLGNSAEEGCVDVSIDPVHQIQGLLPGSEHEHDKINPSIRFTHSTCGTKYDVCGEIWVNNEGLPKSVYYENVHSFAPRAVHPGNSAVIVGPCGADLVVEEMRCDYTVQNDSPSPIRMLTGQGTETRLIAQGDSSTFESIARGLMTILNKDGDAIQTIRNQKCESTYVFNGETFDKCSYEICNRSPMAFDLRSVTNSGHDVVKDLGTAPPNACFDPVSVDPTTRIQAQIWQRESVLFSHSTCGTRFEVCGVTFINKSSGPVSAHFASASDDRGHAHAPHRVAPGDSVSILGDCGADLMVRDLKTQTSASVYAESPASGSEIIYSGPCGSLEGCYLYNFDTGDEIPLIAEDIVAFDVWDELQHVSIRCDTCGNVPEVTFNYGKAKSKTQTKAPFWLAGVDADENFINYALDLNVCEAQTVQVIGKNQADFECFNEEYYLQGDCFDFNVDWGDETFF